ncbi:unnamed protein product [Strongylus vulgaris]|uniref:Uncharacterized protein n=1 Tax=Strongylus vulgaris TaxID=40348 RepID=A0A3P7LM32_STRVU|nr:unnamed protein product [Strongylus vulgaris]
MRKSGCQKKGSIGSGDKDQDCGMRIVTVLLGSYLPHTFFTTTSSRRKNSCMDMRVTQRYDLCGDRPHSPKVLLDVSVVPYFNSSSDHRLLRAKVQFSRKLEKKICHHILGRIEVIYGPIEEDPNEVRPAA